MEEAIGMSKSIRKTKDGWKIGKVKTKTRAGARSVKASRKTK